MLKRIISGAQSGAGLAGLKVAKDFGLETGGSIPKGWITTDGPHPEYAELYNIVEHYSPKYPPRTFKNVRDSDGTIRLAFNFNSPGEICTLKALDQYLKPYMDVDLNNPGPAQEVADWIVDNSIETLNIAGNSEKTYKGTEEAVYNYLKEVLSLLDFKEND
ncbi:MAG: hypothetical protein DWQ19_10790 [Crenarchaeota archaeon]|nr:MAG: hypothetical protein DWQ19_10790 [Thermoproteota archaeon]